MSVRVPLTRGALAFLLDMGCPHTPVLQVGGVAQVGVTAHCAQLGVTGAVSRPSCGASFARWRAPAPATPNAASRFKIDAIDVAFISVGHGP
jgi:hypothetical protein